ncbi:MAG: hypothetical protein MJZ55_02870 [Paludibacteraceae bacterium]|nr:hypothetical protein [Paludibacteraceae bacterium]
MSTVKVTVVYVFGPSKDYDAYMSGKSVEWLKIGMTNKKSSKENIEDVARERISQEAHTGLPVTCKLYDVFSFPSNGKVDLQIRRKLREIGYSNVDFSSDKSNLDDKEIKPGTEFVYNVNRNQVKHAVMSYTFDLLMNCLGSQDDQMTENLTSLYGIVSENLRIESSVPDDENESNLSPRSSSNMVSLWNKVKSYLKGIEYTNYGRPYVIVKSKHEECRYSMAFNKKSETLLVCFESYAKKDPKKKKYFRKPKGDDVLRDQIQDAIDANLPSSEICNLQPEQGVKRSDKWTWISRKSAFESDEDNAKWFAGKITEMYEYFENLQF